MKETINNTSQCVTRSKTYSFDRIPLDLKEKILLKLKADSISKFIIISKSWSSIVREKDFTNMYLSQSSTRPRILVIIGCGDIEMQFFHSCSQEDPSSDHQRFGCYSPNANNVYDFSPPVRGLICSLNKANIVVIGNPSTCQFVTLPRVKTLKKDIYSFFGYDHVNGVYKVLCMTVASYRRGAKDVVSEEHQVFTVGAKQKWRKIECTHPHYPPYKVQGICNNRVVYYLALTNHVQSLICFDLASEKFSVMKLPSAVRLLVNYSEKIAVTNLLSGSTLNLWVLKDVSEQKWSKLSIEIPVWTPLFANGTFKFRGILNTGELIFQPCASPIPFF